CVFATLVALGTEVLAPHPRWLFLLLAGLFSGSALTLYSLAVSHINDKLEPSQMVAASSRLLLINGMAAATGPTIAGSALAVFGPRAYFGTLGALTAALALYDLWRKARSGPVPSELKGPFVNTQQIVANAGLDPAPMAGVEELEPVPQYALKSAKGAPSSP